MIIGILSDVHANLPALNAVIDDAPSLDMIIHAGDVVGYNPYPSEVIEKFQELQINSIQGNHDIAVLDGTTHGFSDEATTSIHWTDERLNEEERAYLQSLPKENRFTVDETTIAVVHGFIDEPDEYVYPTELTMNHFNKIQDGTDILIYGHTHYPLITQVDGRALLNPGSVGQPRDGDRRPSYVVLDTETASITLHRCTYDVKETTMKIAETNIPNTVAAKLRTDYSSR